MDPLYYIIYFQSISLQIPLLFSINIITNSIIIYSCFTEPYQFRFKKSDYMDKNYTKLKE